MAHYGVAVEYGLHVLVTMATMPAGFEISAKDLASFQGVPPEYLAKILGALRKAGIVESAEGFRGGYRLAKKPADITFLQIVDAIEGSKMLFECTEVRQRCLLYAGKPPKSATSGLCAIHAVMREAERRMREVLAEHTLQHMVSALERKRPQSFARSAEVWLRERSSTRRTRE